MRQYITIVILLLSFGLSFSQSKNINETGKPIFVISTDLAQYAIRHVQANTEVIGKKRKFGLNIYFNKGLSPLKDPVTYLRREATVNPAAEGGGFYKSYYVGFDTKFYPKVDTKKLRYFYSFGLEAGKAHCYVEKENTTYHSHWVPHEAGNVTIYEFVTDKITSKTVAYYDNPFCSFHHKEGCIWTITKWLYLEVEGSVGFNSFTEQPKNTQEKKQRVGSIKYGLGLHLGFAL